MIADWLSLAFYHHKSAVPLTSLMSRSRRQLKLEFRWQSIGNGRRCASGGSTNMTAAGPQSPSFSIEVAP